MGIFKDDRCPNRLKVTFVFLFLCLILLNSFIGLSHWCCHHVLCKCLETEGEFNTIYLNSICGFCLIAAHTKNPILYFLNLGFHFLN